jgi:GNAT superfamily N-acetyltransferase
MRLRTKKDAECNLELLAEHEGATTNVHRRSRAADGRAEPTSASRRLRSTGYSRMSRGGPDRVLRTDRWPGLIDDAEIAFELLPRFRGYGYATEAAGAVMDAAFAMGRQSLWATVEAGIRRRSEFSRSLGFTHIAASPTNGANSFTWFGLPHCDESRTAPKAGLETLLRPAESGRRIDGDQPISSPPLG